ncbi:50S ribosome-binding GTPase [Streptosporangium sp. NBC_01755]|uniref:GTPase n=1 Tax=unclassified Streptosporangium TaxID=2632669 RepID=UPI002DDA19E4|nr:MULTISPECIES: GTPase [unclassified Streptosporangium]WSA25798.1 50S ribosome-binding GTPase [Streptosporangium sp. NBC_01810]WSD02811.1 50S ribosome-binding GTPase [Streptosporangium sp. NBC_01755]
MKLLRREKAVSLDDRLAALARAADLADGRLDAEAVAVARSVVSRAGVRASLSVDHTAVALAGATGSGKSSLFNLLSGTSLATVGVTRPTTSTAQAALWEGGGAGPLLDWLGVPRRHELLDTSGSAGVTPERDREIRSADVAQEEFASGEHELLDVPGSGVSEGGREIRSAGPVPDAPVPVGQPSGMDGEAAGLILLDLPDHDSIEPSHRLEVDRLVELVDLLVWVLDPQKYADAAVHDRYLRPLARHREVTVVVLNQIDRLSPAAAERCLKDLRRLLDTDGPAGVPVIGVSARTGAGIPELRSLLASRVANRRSWAARLAADTGMAADALGEASSATTPGENLSMDNLVKPLRDALSEAAGVPAVVEAVARSYRHRSIAATGWPPTRWIRRLRPDPLRRLRLDATSRASGESGEQGNIEGNIVGRTSIPVATVVQRSRMDNAIREAARSASAGLPAPWTAAVRQAARSHGDELEDGLDRAVATTSLGAARRPLWWRLAGLAQWPALATVLAGGAWLLALVAIDYLRLPQLYLPTAGELPWPTTLLIGGVLLGLLIALLSRVASWAGGRRRARRAARALRESVDRVARELVLDPVEEELSRYHRFTEAVTLARNGTRR